MLERESEEEVPLPQLAACRAVMQKGAGSIGGDSFDETIRLFEERNIVPKAQFEALRDAAKKKAFTVAGLAVEELLGDTHAELARQIRESKEKTYFDEVEKKWVYKGPNLREFDKFARERLENAGWVPANPSHVETILRTNVMGAYSSGRIVETTQPAVIAARPYWQIVGVGDSRQRKTHRKAHGTILAADHPFWRKAYPPFGFNCRCRVISRSKRWVDAHGGPTRVPDGLPDKGFASGIDASLVPSNISVDYDGQRAPTPATPARPIDRPAPIPLPPKPMRVTEPQVSHPLFPVQDNSVEGLRAGTHVDTIVVDKRLSKQRVKAVLDSMNADELDWLASNPIKQVVAHKALSIRGLTVNGYYNWGSDVLAIRGQRLKGSWGKAFIPGESFSVSATRASETEAIKATFHHELGHRLHMRAPIHIDLTLRSEFSKATPITEYASSDHREWFAESYAMYRESPDILKENDPIGFNAVRYVLDHWGIPHGTNP
jgi:SPP1 gp7 family putative phage head morphogenesis protein